MAATNIGLAIWRLTCFYETFVQGSTAVILLNFCAKNPPHRQALSVSGKLRKKALRTEKFLQERLLVFVLFWERLSDKVGVFRLKIELENASQQKFYQHFLGFWKGV